ncbi:hypothetical protein Bca101_077458 [Brassica carinata]
MEENFGKVDDGARFILECKVAVTFYSYSFSPYILFSGKHMEIDPLNVSLFVLTDSIVLFNAFGIPSAVFMRAPSFFF